MSEALVCVDLTAWQLGSVRQLLPHRVGSCAEPGAQCTGCHAGVPCLSDLLLAACIAVSGKSVLAIGDIPQAGLERFSRCSSCCRASTALGVQGTESRLELLLQARWKPLRTALSGLCPNAHRVYLHHRVQNAGAACRCSSAGMRQFSWSLRMDTSLLIRNGSRCQTCCVICKAAAAGTNMGKSGSASAVSARKPHMHAANGAADHLLHSSGSCLLSLPQPTLQWHAHAVCFQRDLLAPCPAGQLLDKHLVRLSARALSCERPSVLGHLLGLPAMLHCSLWPGIWARDLTRALWGPGLRCLLWWLSRLLLVCRCC